MAPDSTTVRSGTERTSAGRPPWWAAAAFSAGLLIALAAIAGPAPVDRDAIERHHAAAKTVETAIPFTIGEWVGREVDVPTSAVDLLKPNVLVSRRYENVTTGEVADLLVVHCFDSRDLAGHYPPVCYPAHGKIPGTTVAKEWRIGGHEIKSMRYTFSEENATGSTTIVVDNFMVLPNGEFGREREDIDRIGKDRQLRLLGAGQIQLVTNGIMPDERRDEVFGDLVGSVAPLLGPFLSGVERE